MRRSQAMARPSPAPTAGPLTIAITTLGIVRSTPGRVSGRFFWGPGGGGVPWGGPGGGGGGGGRDGEGAPPRRPAALGRGGGGRGGKKGAYDLLIKNGGVVDGWGGPAFAAD